MLHLFLSAIALIMMIAFLVLIKYAGKHDFDYTFKKWFVHIHIKSE